MKKGSSNGTKSINLGSSTKKKTQQKDSNKKEAIAEKSRLGSGDRSLQNAESLNYRNSHLKLIHHQ